MAYGKVGRKIRSVEDMDIKESKANYDNSVVKKGQQYFWWTIKKNGKQEKFLSKEYPTNEQLEESRKV